MSETTSPSTQPLEPLSQFTASQIRAIYHERYNSAFLCPTDLYLQIRAISQLRVQVAKGSLARRQVRSAADAIFASIDTFEPLNWTRCEPDHWPFADFPESFTLVAQIFKAAVCLYGILSLPEYASTSSLAVTTSTASMRGTQGSMPSYTMIKSSYRSSLLCFIRSAWNTRLRDKKALYWPLIVAGVAVADGDAADQEYVGAILHRYSVRPDSTSCPFATEDKLRAVWASGKTGWDDCFDEPLLGLCT